LLPHSFFFYYTASTQIYTLSLHDALPILNREEILKALESVIDPELRRSIVELGMVRSIEPREGGQVEIMVSLTTPGCPIRNHFQDRKSTRLNSSHLVISYAVFCLKKKKEI